MLINGSVNKSLPCPPFSSLSPCLLLLGGALARPGARSAARRGDPRLRRSRRSGVGKRGRGEEEGRDTPGSQPELWDCFTPSSPTPHTYAHRSGILLPAGFPLPNFFLLPRKWARTAMGGRGDAAACGAQACDGVFVLTSRYRVCVSDNTLMCQPGGTG